MYNCGKAGEPMTTWINRRSFVAGGLASAALSSTVLAKKPPPETRRLFDAVTGEGLPGVRIIVKRVGGKGKWKLKTDSEGLYPFGKIVRAQTDRNRYRVRIEPKELDDRYVAYDGFFYLNPGEYTNDGIGDIGLIPLYTEALPFSFSDIVSEEDFRARWLTLLGELFFAVDRAPEARPKRTNSGAITGFGRGETITVRVSDALTSNEYRLIRGAMGAALKTMTDGIFIKRRFERIADVDTTIPTEELPLGTITVSKRGDFPRPAERSCYGTSGPYEIYQNPNEIISARIYLDTYTLDEVFRDGDCSGAEKTLARHLIQRCTLYALGWRPTLLLPNASAVDDNYGPPGQYTRRTITPVDRALAAVITGGGSGCYSPGMRWDRRGAIRLIGEPDFPVVAPV